MKNWKTFLGIFLAATGTILLTAVSPKPKPKGKSLTVAFYNVENLFDTKDDPKTNDQQFLPDGSYEWTDERYEQKLAQMGKVIQFLGDDDGPEILGLCEIENRDVLEDLVAVKALKKRGYGIAHTDSPDQRGIDVALLYKTKRFMPLYQKAYNVPFPENKDIKTRDIFLVKGILDKKIDVTFIVNHWPSRRGGKESSWKRERAAQVLRHVVDSIITLDPYANIVMMGDFNDGPLDMSMSKVLMAAQDSIGTLSTMVYNCMADLKKAGRGTLKYRGAWNLFDQVVVSVAMTHKLGTLRYVKGSASIYNPDWMAQTEETGDWKDAPRRTYIGRRYHGDVGFSDHFPVYVTLQYQ